MFRTYSLNVVDIYPEYWGYSSPIFWTFFLSCFGLFFAWYLLFIVEE